MTTDGVSEKPNASLSFLHRTSLRFTSRNTVPPPVPRFAKIGSQHMLPSSNLSPNKYVFSSKHRLVKRDLPFFQSKNRLQVTNYHSSWRLISLLKYDWFHVMLRISTPVSLFALLGLWTAVVLLFAGIYMGFDRKNLQADCGLGLPGEAIIFQSAFAFSLETCTTVGYGLPNGSNMFFAGDCAGVVMTIYFQMIWSMMFNAFLFAFFFAKSSKCESRGVQVIFSNKAIISNRPDVPYPCFHFQVMDVDGSYPVVESHIRLYVVTQKSPIPIPLRTIIPNDELGGMIYLSLPCQVVHAMDAYSPLVPRSQTRCRASATVPAGGLHLRQVDSSTNTRYDFGCPICGETYGSIKRLIKHGKYVKQAEAHDGFEVEGTHQEIDWDELEVLLTKSATWTIQQLEAFFRSSVSEILCIVEGIDPLVSGTFQAIHSYQIQDIHFGEAHFADCVCLHQQAGLVVDLNHFHKIRPTAPLVTAATAGDGEEKEEGGSEYAKDNGNCAYSDSSSVVPFGKTDESLQPQDKQTAWSQTSVRHVPAPENLRLTKQNGNFRQSEPSGLVSNHVLQHLTAPPTLGREVQEHVPMQAFNPSPFTY